MTANTKSNAIRTYAIEGSQNGTYEITIWHMSRKSSTGTEIDAKASGYSSYQDADNAARSICAERKWKYRR